MIKALKKAILFIASFLMALICLDVYVQLAEIQTPMETYLDARLGPVYIPHKRIIRFSEGFFMGSVNQYGYMGPAVPPRRSGSERRILLLGDSFVLGHTVLPRHHFARYLEEELSQETGVETHALNFGKADSSLENMYQYYMDHVSSFDHDLAIFFLSQRDLMPWAQGVAELYPAVRLQGNELVITRDFRSSHSYRLSKFIEPLLTRSALLRLAFNAFKVLTATKWETIVFDKLYPLLYPYEDRAEASEASKIKELPELKLAILHKLAQDPRNVIVIQSPIASGVFSDVTAMGMPVIDLASYLEHLRSQGQDPTFWPVAQMWGHWNHAAHPRIGRFLADQITDRDLIK